MTPSERSPHFGDASALVFAAHLGRTEIAEVLLNAGARIDDVGVGGQSACHIAAQRGNTNLVRGLLAHRPNLALRNINGESALQIANNVDIMWLLIQAGAPLDDAVWLRRAQLPFTC